MLKQFAVFESEAVKNALQNAGLLERTMHVFRNAEVDLLTEQLLVHPHGQGRHRRGQPRRRYRKRTLKRGSPSIKAKSLNIAPQTTDTPDSKTESGVFSI